MSAQDEEDELNFGFDFGGEPEGDASPAEPDPLASFDYGDEAPAAEEAAEDASPGDYAPEEFSPEEFAPEYSPEEFAPEYSPEEFAPEYSPEEFAPEAEGAEDYAAEEGAEPAEFSAEDFVVDELPPEEPEDEDADDVQGFSFGASAGERTIEPLRPTSTRREPVEPAPRIGGEEPERTIEPLRPVTTRTESSRPADSRPLVMSDQGQVEEVDEAATLPQLRGEVRSLRSRNQILRAERTSMAGRKYALEMVIESLKEKLEQVGELCERFDAPGELGEALREIREMVGQARAIASGKHEALAADLVETERTAQLKQRQELETKLSDLTERAAGYQAERDALREQTQALDAERRQLERQLADLSSGAAASGASSEELEQAQREVARLEQDRLEMLSRLSELESFKQQAMETLEDAVTEETRANAKLEVLRKELGEAREQAIEAAQARALAEAAEQRAKETERRMAELRRDLLQQLDQARGEAQVARAEADLAQARVREAERELAAGQRGAAGELDERTRQLAERTRQVEELEGRVGRRNATIGEMREALAEIRPILDTLEEENRRLARLVGEAKARGRVDVQELMTRERLLRRLEKLTKAQALGDED